MNLQNLVALILMATILMLIAHPPPIAPAPTCHPEPANRPIWDTRRLNANFEF